MRERLELDRRERLYRGDRQPPNVRDRTVILVDDGLATGSTMQAAVLALRQQAPARIVVAVPVGSREACERLGRVADEVVCPTTPEPFNAVGLWYEEFSQTTDEEVRRAAGAARGDRRPRPLAKADSRGRSAWKSCAGARSASRATHRSTTRSSTASATRGSC